MPSYQFLDTGDIIGILARTLSRVDVRLVNHGVRVSYLVYRMLQADSVCARTQQRNLCLTALLHDIGAYKFEEIDKMVMFETKNIWQHSTYGYLFLKHFSFLEQEASAVLFHHADWTQLLKISQLSPGARRAAQLLNLADRADIYHMGAGDLAAFADTLRARSGTQFDPEVVALFLRAVPAFPTDADIEADAGFCSLIARGAFTEAELESGLRMLVFAIDFRSPVTVTHTIKTARISEELAKRCGLPPEAVREIAFGALLHDLGKISIPLDVLEFPGKLSPAKMAIMRTHVDLTREILGDSVPESVREIAARHHERLDGSGYPRGLRAAELTAPQRIVAVADVVSALTDRRSYKDSFPKEKTLAIVREEMDAGHLDAELVRLLLRDFDSIMASVAARCAPVLEIYDALQNEYSILLQQLGTA